MKLRRFLLLVAVGLAPAPGGAAPLTSPKEHFGFAIGDDFQLATYSQTEAYFKKLASESDRLKLVDIGPTEEGRRQYMMIVSAPENIRRLDHYKQIAQKLARAEGLTDEAAHALAAEGKAVVWIDGGLHASETVGSHQLIEVIWELTSGHDPEIERVLQDVIILCTQANPDGQELVSNWYMREPDPTKRVLTITPRLYQKYIGHDNNRDFFYSSQKETTNINRQLFLEWFPQIVYNHHQPGPPGVVIFVPPFRDPFNYNLDPLVVTGIEALGNAIQQRFLEEGKPGATSRSGAPYSTWFNGGLRTTSYFHNEIGLLTEIIGNPTPIQIPLIAKKQLPSNDLVSPIAPQPWHYRQSIDYEMADNRAVLDYAQRQREVLLFNIYRMGRNSIERGSRDNWTARPSRLAEVARLAAAEPGGVLPEEGLESGDASSLAPSQRLAPRYYEVLHQPAWRDPRGFILPADQADFPTAIKFLNALAKNGIALERATADFTVAGRRFPRGSYVVKTNQAFRPHILDMFEPQDHPDDFRFEGGPPNRPYDVTGYTLAFQMGVQFVRVLEAFDGPFEKLPYGELQKPPAGAVEGNGVGFVISHAVNDSTILVNRLLKEGASVYWLAEGTAAAWPFSRGEIYIPDRAGIRPILEKGAAELGLTVQAVATAPSGPALKLALPRIALWDRFGGSIPSGWTRWLLEQFEFPFEVIYPQQIDAGNLRANYDAVILVTGAVPPPGGRAAAVAPPRNLPAEFAGWTGRLTAANSVPKLKEFLQGGGSILALGSSTNLAYQLGLPLKNALVERGSDGREHPLTDETFYVPGSILSGRVDLQDPVAWGMTDHADFYFERSPAFFLPEEAVARGLKPIAWFESATPLRSGWAWGQRYLKDTVTIARASVGPGQLYLMASEVAFRGQTHGTFKLLFNALYLAGARPVPLP